MEDQFANNTQPNVAAATTVEWKTTYSQIIGQYIPYFNRLGPELRQKFLERTYHFRNLKKFHYLGMAEQPDIPILVSAAAVQLTLGLDNYELPFFTNIYVTPDAYAGKDKEVYIGLVAPDGIYLSWKYFLHGYSNSTDNVNVGIHEMAHALAHQHFISQAGIDAEFTADLEKYCEVYGPEISRWFVSRRSYLRPYAFTSFQEFWAVSVEAFFENPAELKLYLPGLYTAISNLLNQDPMGPSVGQTGA